MGQDLAFLHQPLETAQTRFELADEVVEGQRDDQLVDATRSHLGRPLNRRSGPAGREQDRDLEGHGSRDALQPESPIWLEHRDHGLVLDPGAEHLLDGDTCRPHIDRSVGSPSFLDLGRMPSRRLLHVGKYGEHFFDGPVDHHRHGLSRHGSNPPMSRPIKRPPGFDGSVSREPQRVRRKPDPRPLLGHRSWSSRQTSGRNHLRSPERRREAGRHERRRHPIR